MLEKILEIVEKVIPPSEGDKHVRTWRLVIAGLTLMNAGGLTLHILLACGYIPWYPGFALAGDVTSVKAQLKTDADAIKSQVTAEMYEVKRKMVEAEEAQKQRRISTLKSSLLDLQLKRCSAPSGPARQLYLTSIQEGLTEYNDLTGKVYPLPDCSSF